MLTTKVYISAHGKQGSGKTLILKLIKRLLQKHHIECHEVTLDNENESLTVILTEDQKRKLDKL